MSQSTVIGPLVLNDIEEGYSSNLHKIERKVALELLRPGKHAFSVVSIPSFLLSLTYSNKNIFNLKAISQHVEARCTNGERP